jgi:hypothetical protein
MKKLNSVESNEKFFNLMFIVVMLMSIISAVATFGLIGFALYCLYEFVQKV